MMRCRCLLTAVVGILAIGLCSAQVTEAEVIKDKLFQSKKEYDGEVKKFRQAVEAIFDKREEVARAAGDKKAVDQVKTERDVFAKSGEVPATLPATAKQQMAAARVNLDKAYIAAVKDYVRNKLDAEADAAEKERLEFQASASLLFGTRAFLAQVKHFDLHCFKTNFHKDTAGFKINGEAIGHSIMIHPDATKEASVSYGLGGKYTVFQARVGNPKWLEVQQPPGSAFTFEVVGDGKSLWKSEPVKTFDTLQTCTVNIEKVKTLTLRVRSSGDWMWCHGVWFGPIIAE